MRMPTYSIEPPQCKPDRASPTGGKVGLCELPKDWVSSEDRGGLGGTCILRGCVPKKVLTGSQ